MQKLISKIIHIFVVYNNYDIKYYLIIIIVCLLICSIMFLMLNLFVYLYIFIYGIFMIYGLYQGCWSLSSLYGGDAEQWEVCDSREDRAHSSLTDLVQYHTQVGIKPFIELLTLPCGQVSVLRSVLGRLLWNVISYRLQVTLFKM